MSKSARDTNVTIRIKQNSKSAQDTNLKFQSNKIQKMRKILT